jgi:hypothetical protein
MLQNNRKNMPVVYFFALIRAVPVWTLAMQNFLSIAKKLREIIRKHMN